MVSQQPFLEYLVENYGKFGCQLEFVSDRTTEGFQFVKGFGGIGALLRYQVEISVLTPEEDEEDEWDL